jgi:hypothetical protein
MGLQGYVVREADIFICTLVLCNEAAFLVLLLANWEVD